MSKKKVQLPLLMIGRSCAACEQGMDAVIAHDTVAFNRYGWYAHIVQADPDYPFGVNYHTHGLLQSLKHKDFQICLCLSPEIAHSIVSDLVEHIKAGETFEAGKVASGIIRGGYNITFANAKECDRDVLRIIFPDKEGALSRDVISEAYRPQWEGTTP